MSAPPLGYYLIGRYTSIGWWPASQKAEAEKALARERLYDVRAHLEPDFKRAGNP